MGRFAVIKEFPNYAISRGGQIKRIKKARGPRVGRILKSFPVAGYPAYDLRQNGKRRVLYAHRLVGMAFLPNAKRLAWGNHKSTSKPNPRRTNRQWTTPTGNTAPAV